MTTNSSNGLSRRTVVVGTAWAVPAIIVASAAPALAASGPVMLSGTACKGPGRSGDYAFAYYFQVTLTNNTASAQTYNFTSISVEGAPALTSISPASVTVDPQTITVVTLLAQGSTDSRNGTAVLTYNINGAPSTTTSATIANFPPIQGEGPKCMLTYPSRKDTPIKR